MTAAVARTTKLQADCPVRKFYKANGFFPAPKGPWNAERLQLMRRYGLEQPLRRAALDRVRDFVCIHAKSATRRMIGCFIAIGYPDCEGSLEDEDRDHNNVRDPEKGLARLELMDSM